MPELDGIRALAIWLVFGAHFFFTFPATPAETAFLRGPIAALLAHGWIGVDLFFVLSGYLITTILISTKRDTRDAYFRRFYVRRAARILPLYVVVLVAVLIAERGRYDAYFAMCAVFSANLAQLFSIRIPDAGGPYWSLGVEEQFYLIWPWVVLRFDALGISRAAVAILALEPLLRLGAREPQLVFPWYRADGLAMGALLAAWFATWDGDRRRARTLVLAILATAAVVTLITVPFGVLHDGVAGKSLRITQAVCVFGALTAASLAFSGHALLAPLRSRFAARTALLSYCLYLIHKPLIDGFAWAYERTAFAAALAPTPTLLVRVVAVLALAYGIAALSYRSFEAPLMRAARRYEEPS